MAAMVLLGLVCGAAFAAEQRRKYDEGPLRAEDFAGQVREIPGKAANTATELRYEYRYRYQTSGKMTQVTLQSVEIHAYIRRDASWNRNPDDQRLLDHEQGHADISQIQCLQSAAGAARADPQRLPLHGCIARGGGRGFGGGT